MAGGRGFKLKNDYSAALTNYLYKETPKAVFAAIAVSLLSRGGDDFSAINEKLVEEWKILHENGIVPQPPPKEWR